MVFEREAPIAPETAWPRGGSSGCDILQFDCPSVLWKGDVNEMMIARLFGRGAGPDRSQWSYNKIKHLRLVLASKLIHYSKKHNKQNALYNHQIGKQPPEQLCRIPYSVSSLLACFQVP
jgi:hypothetical protein